MRYPTLKELYELQNNCRWERFVITSDEYDYKGLKVTGPNGNSIYVDSDIFSCTYSGPGSWYDRDEYYILRINDYYDDQLIMYVGPTYIGAIRGVYDDGSPLDHGTYAGDNGGDDNNGGQGGNGGTTDPTGGKVSGKIKVYGEGLNYSSYAQSINGNSVTVEWVYYPKTGKYAFYGGKYCSSPDSNGGKGLLYDCQKGYNSVKIDSDYASSSGHYREWKYEVYVQFTIP